MIRKWFLLWGAEDEEDGEETEEESPETKPTSRTLTGEELEQMTARAADKAKRKQLRDLASELGFSNAGELKAFVESKKTADQESLDEQTKAVQEAERTRKEFEARTSALLSEKLDLAIARKVIGAGVSEPKRIDRITALIKLDLDPELIEDEESWEEAIAATLTAARTDVPELFGKPSVGSGDGGSRGPSTDGEDDADKKKKQLEEEYTNAGYLSYDL